MRVLGSVVVSLQLACGSVSIIGSGPKIQGEYRSAKERGDTASSLLIDGTTMRATNGPLSLTFEYAVTAVDGDTVHVELRVPKGAGDAEMDTISIALEGDGIRVLSGIFGGHWKRR
jgi:hypothetical protein